MSVRGGDTKPLPRRGAPPRRENSSCAGQGNVAGRAAHHKAVALAAHRPPRPLAVPDAASSLQQQLPMSSATRSGNGQRNSYNQQDRRQHPHSRRADRSGVLRWAMAVVFTVLAIVVLLAAVAVLLVVLVLQPRAPYLAVQSARLDSLVYDQQGVLGAQLSLGVVADNGNAHAGVSFSELELRLSFHRVVIAILRADPFGVPPRGALPLGYVARSSGVPLDGAGREAMEGALRAGVVPFVVAGQARTRWKVGGFVPVQYWTRLACELLFFWPNGTALDFTCNSKSKSRY